MDAGKMNVNFVDDQLDGISGIVTSPELFKPLAFRFDDWRGAMIYNTATDATLYNSQLPWLDKDDAQEVLAEISRVIVAYLRGKFEQAA
jgi:hypothetical protein